MPRVVNHKRGAEPPHTASIGPRPAPASVPCDDAFAQLTLPPRECEAATSVAADQGRSAIKSPAQSRLRALANRVNSKVLTTLGGALVGGLAIPCILKSLGVGFAEAKQWGMNVQTATFLGTVMLTSLSVWGGFQQLKTILDRNSAQSVPLAMSAVGAGVSLAFLVNGIQAESLAMMINGAGLGAFSVAIAAAVIKRSPDVPLGKKVLSVAAMAGMPAIMALIPQREVFLGSLLLASSLTRIQQPLTMWKERSGGSVEPKSLVTTMLACTVWGVYGFLQHKIPLMISNPIAFTSLAASLSLWFKYGAGESSSSEQ